MSWDRQKSYERVRQLAEKVPDIEISELKREANLANVSRGKPKRIDGVHLYSAVANEAAHVTSFFADSEQDEVKAAVRAVHLWQREMSRVVDEFGGAKIHFQGTRLHVVVYRPVGDMAEVAQRAVALAHALELTTRLAFNEVLGVEGGFKLAAGAAFGKTLATRAGSHGDSELLFVGDAANLGAKAIKKSDRLRVTDELAAELPAAFPATTQVVGERLVQIKMTRDGVESIAADLNIGWSIAASKQRVQHDLESTPLVRLRVRRATTAIDKNTLGLSNSKLNDAVTLFGDLDGFTAIVQDAASEADEERLIRRFHVTRAELRHVATQDFETLRVQYQGDRIQALKHLPHDDESQRALQAVRLAAAWQSSMEITIPQVLGHELGLHLAIGIDAGPTVLSKLGERGNRDLICLGTPVRRAARIESNLEGDEIGITAAIRDLLPDRVAKLFRWEQAKDCFVVKGLRFNDVLLAEQAQALDDVPPASSTAPVAIPIAAGVAHIPAPRPRWHP